MYFACQIIQSRGLTELWQNSIFQNQPDKVLNHDLGNFSPLKMTLQATIVPSSIWFLYEHLLLFFVAHGEWKLCKWRWALLRKNDNANISHPCCPLNTHTSCTQHSVSLLLAQFGGSVSFGCLSSTL